MLVVAVRSWRRDEPSETPIRTQTQPLSNPSFQRTCLDRRPDPALRNHQDGTRQRLKTLLTEVAQNLPQLADAEGGTGSARTPSIGESSRKHARHRKQAAKRRVAAASSPKTSHWANVASAESLDSLVPALHRNPGSFTGNDHSNNNQRQKTDESRRR